MFGGPVAGLEHTGGDVAPGKYRHRIPPGLVQQHDVVALGDPRLGEHDAHPPPQRFCVQESLGERVGHEARPIDPGASGPCCHAVPWSFPSLSR